MRIGELSRRTGISIDTLRFYEKRGLLNETHFTRRESGYREYGEAAVERLQLIRGAQAAGFTLGEIVSLFDRWETQQLTDDVILRTLQEKSAQVKAKIAALQTVQAYLEQKICHVTGAALPQPPKRRLHKMARLERA